MVGSQHPRGASSARRTCCCAPSRSSSSITRWGRSATADYRRDVGAAAVARRPAAAAAGQHGERIPRADRAGTGARLVKAGALDSARHGAEPSEGRGQKAQAAECCGSTGVCATCGTVNDDDARFCKSCGTKLLALLLAVIFLFAFSFFLSSTPRLRAVPDAGSQSRCPAFRVR